MKWTNIVKWNKNEANNARNEEIKCKLNLYSNETKYHENRIIILVQSLYIPA